MQCLLAILPTDEMITCKLLKYKNQAEQFISNFVNYIIKRNQIKINSYFMYKRYQYCYLYNFLQISSYHFLLKVYKNNIEMSKKYNKKPHRGFKIIKLNQPIIDNSKIGNIEEIMDLLG